MTIYGLDTAFTCLSSRTWRADGRAPSKRLHNALVEHGICNFDKTGDVRADDQITRLPVLSGGFPRIFVDREHDVTQTRIDFFARPGQTHGVLAHFQSGSGYAAGIRRFAGTEKDFSLEEKIDTRWDSRHVGCLGNQIATVLDQLTGVFAGDLVLRGARKRAIALDAPGALASDIFCAKFFGVLADAPPPHVLDAFDPGQF